MYQNTYHLYHHQPDPLDLTDVHDQAWLLNNGVNYSVVATIEANTLEKAYEGLLAKKEGHGHRSVEMRTGNFLRATLPGDVLVGKEHAWMIMPDAQLQLISYESVPPWKSYAHDATVECVDWAPNGKHIVAASNTVCIHNLERHEDEARYRSATSYVRHENRTVCAAAWASDGARIASGGYDAEVHIWKPSPYGGNRGAALGSMVICRTEEMTYSYDRKITCIAWAPDAQSLLAGRSNGDIVHWNAITGECLHLVHRHQDDVTALAYSPDGTRLASTSEDGTLQIGSAEDFSQEIVCRHAGKIPSCAWSRDGSLLVSCCEGEQSLQFWDSVTGAPGERIPLSVSSTRLLRIQALACSPDGRFVVAGCDDGTLQMIDVCLRRHVRTYRAKHANMHCVAWSPDGRYIASGEGSSGGAVRVWQAGRGTHQGNTGESV